MLRRTLVTALLLAAGTTASSVAQTAPPTATAPITADSARPVAADSATALAFGQQASEWLWAAEVDSLWAHLDDASRTSLGSPTNISDQVLGFVGQFGAETAVVRESLERQGENYRYTRVVSLEAAEEPWTLVWTLSPDLRIMNLDLQPGG
jgi:hypothetical protein